MTDEELAKARKQLVLRLALCSAAVLAFAAWGMSL